MLVVGGLGPLGFIDNFIPIIAQDLGLWQFHFVRSTMTFALLALIFAALSKRFVILDTPFVILRSFMFASAMMLYFGSLAFLPIAQVGAGLFSSPIFVLIFTVAYMRMRIGWVRICAVALGFAGAVLLLRPNAEEFELLSVLPLCAGAFYAIASMVTRHRLADEEPLVLLSCFFAALWVFGVMGVVYFWALGVPTNPAENGFFGTGWQAMDSGALWLVFAQAVVSIVGVFMLTRAYQLAEPARVAVFEYSFLLWAGVFAYLLWGQLPDFVGFIGISLIVLAGMIIIWRSQNDLAPAQTT